MDLNPPAPVDPRLMTTVTTFATAVDVTLSELRLEAFLPAALETAEALSRAARPEAPGGTAPRQARGNM